MSRHLAFVFSERQVSFPAKRRDVKEEMQKIHIKTKKRKEKQRGDCKEEQVDNRVELTGIYGRRLKNCNEFSNFRIFSKLSQVKKNRVQCKYQKENANGNVSKNDHQNAAETVEISLPKIKKKE